MKIIVFSKLFQAYDIDGLIGLGDGWGIDGWDLCVRAGYAVSPDNAPDTLPAAAARLRDAGRPVLSVSGEGDLTSPENPTLEPLLAAMATADVRLLKPGYFQFNPVTQDYWTEVDRARRAIEGCQALASEHGVKICWHTHSDRNLGLNAGMLAHLLDDFDPDLTGAYLDPLHLCVEGEEFEVAANMHRKYLSMVSGKDVMIERGERNAHGTKTRRVVPAGTGMVDFTAVFECLQRHGYTGPLSVHCEFKGFEGDAFIAKVKEETAFFKALRDKYLPE